MRFAGLLLLLAALALAEDRDQKVRGDRAEFEARPDWVYNDLSRGFSEAKRTGRPLLVVIRCIP